MNRRWMKYDPTREYENLYDKNSNKCVVDLMLKNGEFINMCILQHKHFWCISLYRHSISLDEVAMIRVTHNTVRRFKRHNFWKDSIKCRSCNKLRTKPLPKECSIIYPYNYYQYYPELYSPHRRLKPTFSKKDEIYLFPVL